ncbi:hypothetical protein CRD_02262 [Raphidiopsis brookii D9]|nr:hypothetical protein CRD_02262 [Raphidiopsis brookii D9]
MILDADHLLILASILHYLGTIWDLPYLAFSGNP